ncbi:MAG: sigma-54 dependent transcriptional regulator [Ignavibacteria bacterium]|jgi:DNA-binding NtrC family response regulator
MEKLLVIDDNLSFLDDVEVLLGKKFQVIKASTAGKGLDILASERISVVLLDLQLTDMFGLEVLQKIHNEIDSYLPVIIITEHDEIEYVVKAMKYGAYDFIAKDFNLELLSSKIMKALERRELEISIQELQNTFSEHQNKFIFSCEEMKKLNYEITRLANLSFDILLTGETGSGKDLVATEIYSRSKRKDKPFISVPIRSLSETIIESELFGHEKGAFSGADKMKIGKFEAANKGTIYIPEISSLPESIQLKLLYFMQYKAISRVGQDPQKGEIKLDLRLIMATNDDLQELVEKGKIREDFYHRITGLTLNVPPLRERKDDIEHLANYFLNKYSQFIYGRRCEFDPKVIEAFKKSKWPGNVRELSNIIKNVLAYTDSPVLTLDHFPTLDLNEDKSHQAYAHLKADDNNFPDYKSADLEFKRAYFQELWQRSGEKVSMAAKIAGLTPQGLRKILNALKLN